MDGGHRRRKNFKLRQNPIAVAVIGANSAFKASLERRTERPFATASPGACTTIVAPLPALKMFISIT
jgi:hypothetical protein